MTFRLFPKKFGWLPYIFLIYLVFPLLNMMEEDGWKAAIGYGLLLLFLVTYRQLYQTESDRIYTVWLLTQIAIIAVLSFFYNPYNFYLGFYPANFLGWYDNEKLFRRAIAGFGLYLIGMFIYLIFGSGILTALTLLPFALVMLIMPFAVRSSREKEQLAEKLEEAREEISELIKREERVRISRDLHDSLGHTLSLLTMQSQLVQRAIDRDPGRAKDEAKDMEKTARAALRQVRELVSEMRSIRLPEAFAEMAETLDTAEIRFRVDNEGDWGILTPVQENVVGMCLKEITTNVVRHSRASSCTLIVQKEKGGILFSVRDDGIGIGDSRFGNGLNGIRERLTLIDGTLDVDGESDGTSLRIRIPVIGMKGEMTG